MSLLQSFQSGRRRTQRRGTGWIGVDIGLSSIKIAQVERIAGQTRIARSMIVHAEEGHVFDRAQIEDGIIAEKVSEAISLHGGFQGRLTACCLSMSFCELRTMSTAVGTTDEQRELIGIELENDTHVDSALLEFDFWENATHRQDSVDGMTQVHVLSIDQAFADLVGNGLLRAGLKCQALDAVPFTLLRSVHLPGSNSVNSVESDEPVAAVDWGYSQATFVLIRDGQPVMSRLLKNSGVRKLLDAISRRLKLSRAEANTLLTTYGLTSRFDSPASPVNAQLQKVISEISADIIQSLCDELQRTLSFLELESPELMPQQVWLFGGGSNIRNIAECVQSRIEIPAAVWELNGLSRDTSQSTSVMANAAALSSLVWEQ